MFYVIAWPFRKVANSTKSVFAYGSEFFFDPRSRNVMGIIGAFPMFIVALGLITGLIGYLSFVVSGGYSREIAMIQENDSILGLLTTATSLRFIYNTYLAWLVALLFVVITIASYYLLFRNDNSMIKKISSVLLVVTAIVLPIVMFFLGKRNPDLYMESSLFQTLSSYQSLIIVGLLIAGFFIASRNDYSKPMLCSGITAVIMYVAIIPGFFLLLENIISVSYTLLIGLAMIAALGIAAVFFGGGDSGDGAASAVGAAASGSNASIDKRIEKKRREIEHLRNENEAFQTYNERQAQGCAGYQHYSAESNRRAMEANNGYIKGYEAEIARLERQRG